MKHWGGATERETYFLLEEAYKFLTHTEAEDVWSWQVPDNYKHRMEWIGNIFRPLTDPKRQKLDEKITRKL